MKKDIKCHDFFRCDEKECPAFLKKKSECWLTIGTYCRNDVPKGFFEKVQLCLECEFFKAKADYDCMEMMCSHISQHFAERKKSLDRRERELEALTMEMALGLSEVFEALKKISAGDPYVRIRESSGLELIRDLKQLVNQTAKNLGHIVDLSHEFAIGLAEHFDVMHRVSTGNLSARVSGNSRVELLEALKNVTNMMIDSVSQEINDRKVAEAKLRKSEERFRTLAEKSPIGITIMNADTSFEYINPTFTEIFGYKAEELPDKKTWFKKAYPDDDYRKMVLATWKTYWTADSRIGEIKPRLLTVRCKDGQDKIISFRTVVLKDGRHFVTYSDITDRARAQEVIRQSEERYRILVENIQDGVFIIQDGKMQFVNEAFARMVGYSVEEIIGMDFRRLVAPEDQENVMERHWRRLEGENVEKEYEFCVLHKDGKTRVLVNMNEDILTYREKVSTIGTVKDITERRRAEEEKRKLESQLQRSQKMEAIGTLAGGVAHDLNNILSGIVSYPTLVLLELQKDSPLRKPLMTIQKSGEKAAAIVQDLLTLARRGVASTEVIDLNQIITEYLKSPEFKILKSFHPEAEFETFLEEDLLHIIGSPIHLSKTLMNLISNAAEAMPSGGQITISTENKYVDASLRGYDSVGEGDYAVMKISDTGVGISAEEMERIFEPFYTKKKMGRSGTGLGMAVVWGTVKDHHGFIDVQSTEGVGTTFTLYFPVTREELPADKIDLASEDFEGKGELILIVDDVVEQREIASNMLKKLGYSVATVSSGEEAIEYLTKNPVDLMILDMIMPPGIDGLETYREVLKLRTGQKAIIASGFSETNRVKEAQRLGAGEYVKKPYTMEKIGLAIRRELERRES